MGAVTDQLITQQGSGVLTQYGDYIAVAAGLDQPYRYYVEVPTGTSCLFVDIFDADIGTNAVNNDQANDRDRAIGSYNTTAAYRLTDPSGTSVIADQLFTVGNNAGPAGADNAWLTLFAGSTTDNFRDEFNGVPAYNGNNGSLIWAGNWTEFGDDGAVATGNVQVNVNRLRMRAAVRGATRVADLSAAGGCSAILSYTVDESFRTHRGTRGGRGATGRGRCARHSRSWVHFLLSGDGEDRLETLALELRRPTAEWIESIVAAPRIVVLRRGAFSRLRDETRVHQTLEGAVEGPRAEPDATVRRGLDVLHDAEPVTGAVGEREQNVKNRRRQR